MTEKQTAIFVLGMHRSGTSAFSGCLHFLGFKLGSTLIPADSNNARGYWEDSTAVRLNDLLLCALSRSWQDEKEMPANWLTHNATISLSTQIDTFIKIKRDFSDHTLWGLKDPRLCCVLPAWQPIIKKYIDAPIFVLLLRHPSAVAASLEKRDGIPKIRGYLIWLRYMLDAEYNTRGENRVIISYDELVKDWENTLDPLLSLLDNKIIINETSRLQISDFISKELCHHNMNDGDDVSPYFLLAKNVHQALLKNSDLQTELFDEFRAKLNQIVTPFDPWINQIQKLICEREILIQEKNTLHFKLNIEIEKLYAEIKRVKNTVSWKITKPLRAIWNIALSFSKTFLHNKK